MRDRKTKLKILLLICLSGTGYVLQTLRASGSTDEVAEQQRSRTNRPRQSTVGKTGARNYSKFSHNIAQHKQACDSCHKFPTANFNKVRIGEASFPDVTDYPQHPSCIGCHRQQFFTGAQPVICTVCHTNPSPRDGSRHPFPNPPEVFDVSKRGQTSFSEFDISFPHDKHVDIVGENWSNARSNRLVRVFFTQDKPAKPAKSEPKAEESDPKSCAVCHKTSQPQGDSDDEYLTRPPKDFSENAFWLKKGAFKTAPTHVVCFTCHTTDGLQPLSSDCGTCHKLLPPERQIQVTRAHDDFDPKLAAAMGIKDKLTLEKWSRRDTAKFRHEWISHASLSCVTCHNVATLNTLDPKTRTQAKSCGGTGTGCHIEATTDGILNLEFQKKKADPAFECTKCHVRNGKNPAPETHISAVAAATKK